jgi:hypothetical protein
MFRDLELFFVPMKDVNEFAWEEYANRPGDRTTSTYHSILIWLTEKNKLLWFATPIGRLILDTLTREIKAKEFIFFCFCFFGELFAF